VKGLLGWRGLGIPRISSMKIAADRDFSVKLIVPDGHMIWYDERLKTLIQKSCKIFHVLTALNMKVTILRDVRPCRLVRSYQYFGRKLFFLASEVAGSSETLIPIYHIRQCHTAEGHNLHTFESGYFGDRVVRGRILLNWDFKM